jgi:hypothetical protein
LIKIAPGARVRPGRGIFLLKGLKMGTRITQRALSAAIGAAKSSNPSVTVSHIANAVPGDKKLVFYGVTDVGGVEYDLAADNGKLKKFTDVDDMVKYIATAVPVGSGDYMVKVGTGLTLAAAVPGDLVVWAGKQVVKLQSKKVSQQAVIAALDVQLALMDGWGDGSPLQVAKLEETEAQKAAVQADIAAIDAEIDRLTPAG